jgi:hypothetical protein
MATPIRSLLRRADVAQATWPARFSPALVMLLTAVALAVFVQLRLALVGGDITGFIQLGRDFLRPGLPIPVRTDAAIGYDGQAYFRLALDPFTTQQDANGVHLDNGPYRQQRIGYPLLVWALSGGDPSRVPALMLAVNYVGLCLIGGLAALYARLLGRSPLWGLAIAAWPGFIFSIALDLTEIQAAALMLAGLIAFRTRHVLAATILLTLAVLTRETALLVPFGIGIAWLVDWVRGRRAFKPPFPAVLPLAAYVAWQAIILLRWGHAAVDEGARTGLTLPFVGLLHTLSAISPRIALELAILAAFTIAVLFALRSSRVGVLERVGWFASAVLASMLSAESWAGDVGFLRPMTEFYILGSGILLGSRSRAVVPVFALIALMWLVVARLEAMYL